MSHSSRVDGVGVNGIASAVVLLTHAHVYSERICDEQIQTGGVSGSGRGIPDSVGFLSPSLFAVRVVVAKQAINGTEQVLEAGGVQKGRVFLIIAIETTL